MQLTWTMFLIVCPLVGLAGFVDAVAGGGGLISLPAYILAGLPSHFAIGTNKLSAGMGTALATFRYAKKGYIKWKLSAVCVVCALAGSALGSKLALMIDDRVFKIMMLVILPIVACYALFSKSLKSEKPELPPLQTYLISAVTALVLGAYDGFYGPGAGTFMLLSLTGAAHLPIKRANGTMKTMNLASNIASLTVFFFSGKVLVLLGLAGGCFSILGNYLGTKLFASKGAKAAKPIMLCVLAIFFVKVITELIGG